MRRTLAFVAAAFVLVAALATGGARTAAAGDGHDHGTDAHAVAHERWDRDVVDLFAKLPVQDGGRVKPLSTFAGFTLLALNGRRSVTTPEGERLDPTEWMMECLFHPEAASDYACFVVQDTAVLDAIGLAHEGRARRDRYSYAELAPARQTVFRLASQYQAVDAKRRNAVQAQVLDLAHNLMQFESVAGLLGSLREVPSAHDSAAIARVLGAGARPGVAEILARADDLRPSLGAADGDPHAPAHGAGAGDPVLTTWADDVVRSARGVALIPPVAGAAAHAEWLAPADAFESVLYRGEDLPDQSAALADLAAMAAHRDDAAAFRRHAHSFSDRVVRLADGRGEYAQVPLEVAFYKAKFFDWALYAFVLAFLVAAVSWMKPARALVRTAGASVAVGALLLAAGITMRCVIRGRPPVTTLYESILFVTAVGVVASLVAERVHRRGIALSLSTVIGSAGMFLANKYETHEAVDTMPSLVAVLDTNFWLASHVTTVTIGYSAGLLAAAVGHVQVAGRVLGLKKGDPGFYRTLTAMTYGMLCFSLLFSVVGTVLGGIWANESWGRFWGWDPKENGALAIVLWQLVVLHARANGWLREFGVAMASVFGGVVVASSWWGVNLLGVGLHSYGFTSGVLLVLLSFYAIEGAVLVAGVAHLWLRGRGAAPVGADVGGGAA